MTVLRRPADLLIAPLLTLAVLGCAQGDDPAPPAEPRTPPIAVTPRPLDLAGPVSSPDAEISAMCWCGDRLMIVPQHPERFGSEPGELVFFTLPRAEIEAAVDQPPSQPLVPERAVLEAPELIASLPGWDGIEAAVATGDTLFLAIEAEVNGRMAGYLLRGRIHPRDGDFGVVIDTERVAPIPVPTLVPNMSQEALLVAGDRVAVLFEANGLAVNPGAHAALFDFELEYQGTVPLEHVEFRITDATQPLADGTFWVINYFFPDEGPVLRPPVRPTHPVEQLLELRLDGGHVRRSGRTPLDLRSGPDAPAHNWEALVRLPGRGFLLMTDRYPTTVLAFVPWPDADPTTEEAP
jgi:hypothetical protein